MTMKKIYEKPFMKDHKLLQTNNLLIEGSNQQNAGVADELQDDPEEENGGF